MGGALMIMGGPGELDMFAPCEFLTLSRPLQKDNLNLLILILHGYHLILVLFS